MKKYKVKYNQKEYRTEYLNSNEWKSLRNQVMKTKPSCQCCDNIASDLHHMVYRNIVDIKITDLLPVCRDCHNLIHEAIKCKYISQDIKELNAIKNKTLNIKNDEEFVKYKKWYYSKHFLSNQEIFLIQSLQAFVIKKISGLIGKNIWYKDLKNIEFTGSQILKIKQFIEAAIHRRKNKIDKKKNTNYFRGLYGITLANLNVFFRENRRDFYKKY
jgi:hypothetical protein